MSILAYLERRKAAAVAISAVLLALVSWLDYVTGYEISFSVFYLFPVSVTAWALGAAPALLVSLLSAVLWLIMDLSSGHVYGHPNVVYWNAAVRLTFFAVTGLALARIRKGLEREAEQARVKSEMVSLVSHEVNNSLVSISLASTLLREEEGEKISDSRKKCYEVIDQTQRKLSQTVKVFLAKARLESGKFKPERQRVELRALAWETIAALALLAGEKKVAIDTDFPPEVLPADCDPEVLSLVMNNLVLNALKYTAAGGKVTIRLAATEDGAAVRMSVADTGIGIKPGELEEIFAGFHRTEEGKKMSKGTGIGLNASRELLEALGSSLRVESEPGLGSTFYFDLPAWKEN